jgi:hypothetical protein
MAGFRAESTVRLGLVPGRAKTCNKQYKYKTNAVPSAGK